MLINLLDTEFKVENLINCIEKIAVNDIIS